MEFFVHRLFFGCFFLGFFFEVLFLTILEKSPVHNESIHIQQVIEKQIEIELQKHKFTLGTEEAEAAKSEIPKVGQITEQKILSKNNSEGDHAEHAQEKGPQKDSQDHQQEKPTTKHSENQTPTKKNNPENSSQKSQGIPESGNSDSAGGSAQGADTVGSPSKDKVGDKIKKMELISQQQSQQQKEQEKIQQKQQLQKSQKKKKNEESVAQKPVEIPENSVDSQKSNDEGDLAKGKRDDTEQEKTTKVVAENSPAKSATQIISIFEQKAVDSSTPTKTTSTPKPKSTSKPKQNVSNNSSQQPATNSVPEPVQPTKENSPEKAVEPEEIRQRKGPNKQPDTNPAHNNSPTKKSPQKSNTQTQITPEQNSDKISQRIQTEQPKYIIAVLIAVAALGMALYMFIM